MHLFSNRSQRMSQCENITDTLSLAIAWCTTFWFLPWLHMWSTAEQINRNLFDKRKSAGFFTHTWNYNKRLEKEWEINEQINCNLFGKWKFAGLFTHIRITKGWGWEKNQIMCTEGFCYRVLINILDWHLIDILTNSQSLFSSILSQHSINISVNSRSRLN